MIHFACMIAHYESSLSFLPLAQRYAQQMKCRQETLQQLGLALAGEAGARIGVPPLICCGLRVLPEHPLPELLLAFLCRVLAGYWLWSRPLSAIILVREGVGDGDGIDQSYTFG